MTLAPRHRVHLVCVASLAHLRCAQRLGYSLAGLWWRVRVGLAPGPPLKFKVRPFSAGVGPLECLFPYLVDPAWAIPASQPLIAMGLRFRRSARLGPLRFNFSSGGLSSISVGGRGASFNIPVNRSGGSTGLVSRLLADGSLGARTTGLLAQIEHMGPAHCTVRVRVCRDAGAGGSSIRPVSRRPAALCR
jgi:hypothetical protein